MYTCVFLALLKVHAERLGTGQENGENMIGNLEMIPVRWYFYQLRYFSLGLLKIYIIHYSEGL